MNIPGTQQIQRIASVHLPAVLYRGLRGVYHSPRVFLLWLLRLPLVRQARCVQFRRTWPLRDGAQRGTPIVRYYWNRFLKEHKQDVRGRALEIGTTATLYRYGGPALTEADALDLTAHSPEVTVVADLSRADHLPSDQYDCFLNQFTMHVIHDVEAALYHSIRILKPGGVLLINFSCLDYGFPNGLEMGTGAPMHVHWCFTPLQVENLLRRAGLSAADFGLAIYGNLFARIAYQVNLSAEELTRHELDFTDRGHPVLICARVVKPTGWRAERPSYRDPWLPDTTPVPLSPITGVYPPQGPA